MTNPETGKNLVDEAVKAFGRIDIFVSNAGVCQFAEFLEYVFLAVLLGLEQYQLQIANMLQLQT